MDDDVLAQFTSITGAPPDRASQYLRLSDYNLEQAIQLYFESDGVDMGASIEDATAPRNASASAQPARPSIPPNNRDVIQINSDDEDDAPAAPRGNVTTAAGSSTAHTIEDDEAMARRLQEEMYGGGGSSGAGALTGQQDLDEQGVRAPIGRTAETLMAPDVGWSTDPDSVNAAIAEQLLSRTSRSGTSRRAGIFNQRMPGSSSPSMWDDEPESEARRRGLAKATGGESEKSSKNSRLAEMFRPPIELMSALPTWDLIRQEGKDREKWILINVQDPEIFDSHSLNRDIWRNPQIKETIKENFIFKQYLKNEPQASEYIRYYFLAHQSRDAYPHIAIVDPRTGEQVKVWSGPPTPKAADFLMQLHEFLDRYSLKSNSRNPVATRKAEAKKELDVEKMTEEEMLEMALQNSLQNKPGPRQDDPDILTRGEASSGKGKERLFESEPMDLDHATNNRMSSNNSNNKQHHHDAESASDGSAEAAASPFARISATNPHVEPAANAPNTTRLQFRHPNGRVIRRFGVDEQVRRLYEWLKAEPLDGKAGVPFELIFMGKNLIDSIELSIEATGLKNGSVMVEFVQD